MVKHQSFIIKKHNIADKNNRTKFVKVWKNHEFWIICFQNLTNLNINLNYNNIEDSYAKNMIIYIQDLKIKTIEINLDNNFITKNTRLFITG